MNKDKYYNIIMMNKGYGKTYHELQRIEQEHQRINGKLREEINKLTAESTEWESKCYELQQENERLKQNINKVINDINRYLDARKIINDNTKYYYTNEFYKKPIKSNIAYLFNDYLEYLLSILQNGSEEK